MSSHSMNYIVEEEIIEEPLAGESIRSSGRSASRRRSSGHSYDGSVLLEEVMDTSMHSEYTYETLEDSMQNSFNNSFSSSSDFTVSALPPPPPPPSNVVVPPSNSKDDMKHFLKSELGLAPSPAKPQQKKEPPKKNNPALDDMKSFLFSELGLDVALPKVPSKPHKSSVTAALDLPLPADSELARSIMFIKEGVEVEEIEYIVSDDEEIIDDVFDHMGGLDGRDTVMLETFGLAAIPEVSHSEYESDMDESIRHMQASEISLLSNDLELPPVGDTGTNHDDEDDEVDTEPTKPKPTGLHEMDRESEEKVISDTMDVDDSHRSEQESPSKSGKAAKWKDRIKKKRHKSDKYHDDEMKIDDSSADKQRNRDAQKTDKNESKGKSSESDKSKSSKRKESDKTKDLSGSSSETKDKKAKAESQSQSDKKEHKSSKRKDSETSKMKESSDSSSETKAKKEKVESQSHSDTKEHKTSRRKDSDGSLDSGKDSKDKKDKGDKKSESQSQSDTKEHKTSRRKDSDGSLDSGKEAKDKKDKGDKKSEGQSHADAKEHKSSKRRSHSSSDDKDKKEKVESQSQPDKKEHKSSKRKDSETSKMKESSDSSSKKGKAEKQSQSDAKESKVSPKSKHGKKAAKWKDRIQKKRNKTDAPESDSSAADSILEMNVSDAENDMKDPPILPIHVSNAKSKQVEDEPDSREQPVGDVVAKEDGSDKGKNTRSTKKDERPKGKTLFRLSDTIGEVKGDEDNDPDDNVGTTHSMRIFDDEFGSVREHSTSFERSGVSFDLSQSKDNDSSSESSSDGGVIYEVELKDDPDASDSNKRVSTRSNRGIDDSHRSLRGVFDDEFGDTTSNARSSINSMQSSILEELQGVDQDDESTTSNDEAESLLSKGASAKSNQSVTSTGASNKTRVKSSQETDGESKNNFKFELPNELLEAIHCHRSNKNVNENQRDLGSSDVPRTQHETPTEKDGSATYSTVPPTVGDSSRTLGDEVAENTDAGVSTPDLIEEASQDCGQSDDETADSTITPLRDSKKESSRPKRSKGSGKSIEAGDPNDAARGHKIESNSTSNEPVRLPPSRPDREVQSNLMTFPGRLASNRKVIDMATGKLTSFLAAYEMTSRNRRREIVQRSAEVASEGNLPESATAMERNGKHSVGIGIGDRQKLIELLRAKSKMVSREGRKNLVMESIKATMSSESWAEEIRQDELEKRTITTDSTKKPSANSKASKESASTNLNGSKTAKTEGPDDSKTTSKEKKRTKSVGEDQSQIEEPTQGKQSQQPTSQQAKEISLPLANEDRQNESDPDDEKEKKSRDTERSDASKTKSRKRSKTRSRNAPGRSRSLGTEEFLEKLKAKAKESTDQIGANSDDQEDGDDKNSSSKRSRSRGVRRCLSLGPMESAGAKKRKERRNGTSDNATEGHDDKEKVADGSSYSEKAASPTNGAEKLPEIADSATPRSSGSKKYRVADAEEDPEVLLSPGASRRRHTSIDIKSPKVEKPSLERRRSSEIEKSPRNSRKANDKARSPSGRKKSVDLSEHLKHESKSPKKGRTSVNSMKSPKGQKPRRKSGEGKSPKSRKSVADKVLSPTTEKNVIDAIPDLEIMSPKSLRYTRRSVDIESPRLAKNNGTSRRHSDGPTEKQDSTFSTPKSAFMDYFEATDDLMAVDESSPSPSPKTSKTTLRRGQSDGDREGSFSGDPPIVHDDIWGLVKWRSQIDRTAT